MQDTFPFHNLPMLVQSKILRQYVPFFCKTFVLSRIPEFTELLDDQHSWLNSSKSFIRISQILRSLETGLYWNFEQFNTGYYVSIDEDNINFTLCTLSDDSLCDFFNFAYYPFLKENNCISAETFQNFLSLFISKYYTTNGVCVYKTNKGKVFYINYIKKTVHWNKLIFPIKDSKCIINHSLAETFIIKLKDNDIIQLIHHNKQPCEHLTRTEQELEPASLESCILNPQNKRVYNRRKLLDMNFQIVEDHVSLYIDLRALYMSRSSCKRRRLSLCGYNRLKELFFELSNLFQPLKSCESNKDSHV